MDPSGYGDAANMYVLMANDAVNHRDPTGASVVGGIARRTAKSARGVKTALRRGANLISSRAKKISNTIARARFRPSKGPLKNASGKLDDAAKKARTFDPHARGPSAKGVVKAASTPIENAKFGALDELGRPTGVDVVLDASSLGSGTYGRIPRGLQPPGWGTTPGLSRGHLLGRQFRSPGRDPRNVFAQFRAPNEGRMAQVEDLVAQAARRGDKVAYSVRLMYDGSSPVAKGVTIQARGSTIDIFETILNRP